MLNIYTLVVDIYLTCNRFHAGAPTDYDEWAQTGLEGAEQWSFRNFQPSVLSSLFLISIFTPYLDISANSKNLSPVNYIP